MPIAVIAGTGVAGPMDERSITRVSTPYGEAFLSEARFGAHSVVLLARHGPGLNVPPHLINYQANIWALKEVGIRSVISTFAVGSLREDLRPGSLAVVNDFIDFTKRRAFTFFEQAQESVIHTDFTDSYCPRVTRALHDSAAEAGLGRLPEVTYVCMEGPRYETPAEVRMLGALGGGVVGMTGVPEVVLAREIGLCYGGIAIVTNYAAGISPTPLSHEEVVASVSEQGVRVREIIGRAVEHLEKHRECRHCRE